MADTKISDLAAAPSLAAADLVTIVQGGVNKKLTASDIKNYVLGNPVLIQGGPTTARFEIIGDDIHLGYVGTSSYLLIIENGIDYMDVNGTNSMFSLNRGENAVYIQVQNPGTALYYKAFEVEGQRVIIGDALGGYNNVQIEVNQQSSFINLETGGGTLKIDSTDAVSGSFTSQDGKTITVTNGIITAIV
jgi:hypothetical protein